MKKYTDEDFVLDKIDAVWPVGSIYLSVNSTNPATLFGGTWEQLPDRFLLGAGSTYGAGTTGGAATVALAATQVPSVKGRIYMHAQAVATDVHKVDGCFSPGMTNEKSYVTGDDGVAAIRTGADSVGIIDFNNGGTGAAHNNMPPYLAVYMWKRTA